MPAVMPAVAPVVRLLVAVLVACWTPPVAGQVVEPFRAPSCEFCPGHRGIEFSAPPGSSVRAVAAGFVTFSGTVAGTVYVVVQHDDGVRATYGQLAVAGVSAGQRLTSGAVLGSAGPRLYFGLRRGTRYIDPGPWFGQVRARPRLVPIDGKGRRRSPVGTGCVA